MYTYKAEIPYNLLKLFHYDIKHHLIPDNRPVWEQSAKQWKFLGLFLGTLHINPYERAWVDNLRKRPEDIVDKIMAL